MHIILEISELIYNLSIIAMGYAAYKNISDYRVALIFVVLIVGVIFSASPSLLKEASLVKNTGKFCDIDMALKFIMWVQTMYLAHHFFVLTLIINIICMSLTIFCKVNICNEIRALNISVSDAINRINRLDSSYIDSHRPFIIGDFFVIMIFTSFHKNTIEMMISVVICIVYFGIGIYRIRRNTYISKRDIFWLSIIDLAMIFLNTFRLRFITCVLWVGFYSRMRDILKKISK